MTRNEHMKYCKERAIQEINYSKSGKEGIVSMMSDLIKHPETNKESLTSLCMMKLLFKPNISVQEAINFINGFN